MVARKSRAGKVSLDAAGAPAIARRQWQVLARRKGQRVVAPLPRDGVRAAQHPAVDDDTRANPGTENHAEHDLRALPRAIDRLRESKAVSVVLQPDRPAERGFEVARERLADEPGR